MAKDPIKKFIKHPYPVLLNGIVRHYAWGGTHFIPKLLGIPNPQNQPFAELWMGAHPQAPSRAVLNDTTLGLDELIAAAPEKILGRDNIVKLGPSLPYLLKILDARDMLSIQVHPSAAQAREDLPAKKRPNSVGRAAPQL
jgi:mannose-6-phosphate isomerase